MTLQLVRQDVREADFVQDPYPFYEDCRRLGDFVYWENLGRAAAVSHRAVNAVLRDRRFGRSVPLDLRQPVPGHLARFQAVEAHSLLELDGPEHGAIRGQVLRAFTSGRIRALEGQIAKDARTLAARLEVGSNLLETYATPIPLGVICRLLGVPEADGAQLLAWSHAMCRMYVAEPPMNDQLAADSAAGAFQAYLRDVIAEKRRAPGDDLASALVDDGRLDEAQMISTLVLLLNAGHEATVHALGNAIRLLCGTGGISVEECLRFDPPLHLFDRVAQEDCEVLGVRFERGQRVACLLGSANRDEGVFANADQFEPHRDAKAQLAFGAGQHFCIGAPLARLEMEVALRELFATWPGLRVTTPGYVDAWHFHGLQQLGVTAL